MHRIFFFCKFINLCGKKSVFCRFFVFIIQLIMFFGNVKISLLFIVFPSIVIIRRSRLTNFLQAVIQSQMFFIRIFAYIFAICCTGNCKGMSHLKKPLSLSFRNPPPDQTWKKVRPYN